MKNNLDMFSAIGKAFAILSDSDKRKKYDLYGPEEEQSSQQSHQQYYESRLFLVVHNYMWNYTMKLVSVSV